MSDLQTEIEKMRQSAEWMGALPKDPAKDGMVRIPLDGKDWQARAEAMARLERERAELYEMKTETAREYTAKIHVIDEAIARLADEVETREKWVDPQAPLPMRLDAAKKSRRAVTRTNQQDAAAPVEP